MGFRDLDLDLFYNSNANDVIESFYIPVLREAKYVDRAVGYFRSSFFYEISKGMFNFIHNDGVMRVITSTDITEDDIKNIEQGYELKELIEKKLLESFVFNETEEMLERYNYVATLIALGRLEIKIAVMKSSNSGIFHEKWAIFEDKLGNKISINGSNNDTFNALNNNSESFDVNYEWLALTDKERIQKKQHRFKNLWDDSSDYIDLISFPSEILDRLKMYKKDNIISEVKLIKKKQLRQVFIEMVEKNKINCLNSIKPPEWFKPREYQKQALQNWIDNEYRGIYNMATGTGKTLTAIYSMSELYFSNKRIFVIIVCPYQHLVEQWVEDINEFCIEPIIGYSSSVQKDWKERLKRSIRRFNRKKINFSCFITTNSTFDKDYTSEMLDKLSDDVLLIVDEAHNIGTDSRLSKLSEDFDYRLALSATILRKYDKEGTERLIRYFGGIVYEISIEEAIYKYSALVTYNYIINLCFMDDFEFEAYKKLSKVIAKNTRITKSGLVKLNHIAKIKSSERAKVVATMKMKIEKLKSYDDLILRSKNNLIYCGTASYKEENSIAEAETRQVDAIKSYYQTLGMNIVTFTANEDIKSRISIKDMFARGELDGIVAIKCLDEGVNIPSIERAFILASSKDEKQYVQRRGRILRKYEKNGHIKENADLYDFIALPFFNFDNKSDADIKIGKNLIRSEIERMIEFANSAKNKSDVENIINEIIREYDLGEANDER